MKTFFFLLAFASAAAAAPHKCANGASPRLTGDVFAPVECSSETPPVPAPPVPPPAPRRIDWKALEGAYEGSVVQGFGRYELRLELKHGWFGRAEATLKLVELQFHALSINTLKLVPAEGPGRYSIALTTDALPGRKLKGAAVLGSRQLDMLFANGARYSVRLEPGPNASRVQFWEAAPGAPPRSFETELTRVPPKKP